MSAGNGRDVRLILKELLALEHVTGGLFVALDGLVIVAELPPSIAVDSMSALAATLGRELEIGAERLRDTRFQVAEFSAAEGAVFLGATPIGFIMLVADRAVAGGMVRQALRDAVERVQTAWAPRISA